MVKPREEDEEPNDDDRDGSIRMLNNKHRRVENMLIIQEKSRSES